MNYSAELVEHFLDKSRIGESVPGQYAHELALVAKEQNAQLEEALSIITDLEMYSEDVEQWYDHERIDVLRLKQ